MDRSQECGPKQIYISYNETKTKILRKWSRKSQKE